MVKWFGFAKSVESSKDVAAWESALKVGDKWRFNVIRVPFLFSTLDTAVMDKILTLIASHGAKAVLDFHCLEQYTSDPKLGSQALVDAWVKLVTHYKDDTRIVAWQIVNEPSAGCLDPTIKGNNTAIMNALSVLVDAIRRVDPVRPIVWPPSSFWGDGALPAANKRSNVILDIHPYPYGGKTNWVDLQTIADWRINKAKGYVSSGQFDDVWCGEFENNKRGSADPKLQLQYAVYMMQACVKEDFGFSLWKYPGPDDAGTLSDQYISPSGYVPSPTPNPQPVDPCADLRAQVLDLNKKLAVVNTQLQQVSSSNQSLQDLATALKAKIAKAVADLQ